MEVEFIAQALQLLHAHTPRVLSPVTRSALGNLARIGALPEGNAALLIRADRDWRAVQSLLRITLGRALPVAPPPPVAEKIANVLNLGSNHSVLHEALSHLASDVHATFVRHVGVFNTS
jgi:glutamate-ammonia-ligase adenylyltransferase